MKLKFLGSTVALILGILSLLGAIGQIAGGNINANPLTGLVIILGALAYKSLKKRRFGIVKSTRTRKFFEVLTLILVLGLVVLQKDFKMQLANDPVPNLIIPLWIFIAYGIFYFKKLVGSIEPGAIIISKDVDPKEFSRIFAKTLLNETGREILAPLFEASGYNFTWREMAILKFVLGEKDRDSLVQAIEEKAATQPNLRESEILVRQLKLLESIAGKEKA